MYRVDGMRLNKLDHAPANGPAQLTTDFRRYVVTSSERFLTNTSTLLILWSYIHYGWKQPRHLIFAGENSQVRG